MSRWVFGSVAVCTVVVTIGLLAVEVFYLKSRVSEQPPLQAITTVPELPQVTNTQRPVEPVTDPDALARCLAKPDKTSATGECLHTAVSGLLSVMSARTLLAYTDATTSPIEVLRNCHAVGHIIGEETFKRSDTLEAALSSCSTACRSACLHGALGAGVLAQLGEEYAGEDIVHADNATIERIGGPYCAKSAQLCHGIDITVNITIKEKI